VIRLKNTRITSYKDLAWGVASLQLLVNILPEVSHPLV
jgi:hypothetical protein